MVEHHMDVVQGKQSTPVTLCELGTIVEKQAGETSVSMLCKQRKKDNRPKRDYSASVCCPSRPKSARRICKKDR